MADVVIVAYRPEPGCEAALLDLARDHVPHLRRLGLATARPSLVLQAQDGVLVEVFEWKPGAMDAAHAHPEVLALWERYAAVCDHVPLATLAEATALFARFAPIAP